MQRLLDVLRDDSAQPLLVPIPIVFVSEGDGIPDFFLVNRAAAVTVRLTRDVGFDGNPLRQRPTVDQTRTDGVRGPSVSQA